MTIKQWLFGAVAMALCMAAAAGEPAAPKALQDAKAQKAKPTAVAAGKEEAAVLANLKRLYPATTFSSITKTPMKGVFEVIMGPNLAYVTNDARHFLFGHMFDMQSQVDLTAQRKTQLPTQAAAAAAQPSQDGPASVNVAELPLKDAIKRVIGNGARTLVVFSDPLCPYCRRLEADLGQVENTTVYTFLIPILGPNSRKTAETLWAAAMPDRAGDLEVMDRNLKLSQRLRIHATPALIRGDGQLVSGAMPPHELDRWLGERPQTAQLVGDKASTSESKQ